MRMRVLFSFPGAVSVRRMWLSNSTCPCQPMRSSSQSTATISFTPSMPTSVGRSLSNCPAFWLPRWRKNSFFACTAMATATSAVRLVMPSCWRISGFTPQKEGSASWAMSPRAWPVVGRYISPRGSLGLGSMVPWRTLPPCSFA